MYRVGLCPPSELTPVLNCLFRIDSAKDNDEFFAALRPSMSLVYAGLDLRIGSSGWVPDLVRVTVSDPPILFSLTLIELEATKSAALISCRKYLPENSAEIISAFSSYLDRVIRQCKSNAHPHECEFIHLKDLLSSAEKVVVTTAGALRSADSFVEELQLIDQPDVLHRRRPGEQPDLLLEPRPVLTGVLRLSQQQSQALARAIIVLDAVVRNEHHSAAGFHAWRAKSPLRRLLSNDGNNKPELCKLVLEGQNRGVTLDFEKVLSELSDLWSGPWPAAKDPEAIRRLVNDYHSDATAIRGEDRMQSVFERALKHYPPPQIQE